MEQGQTGADSGNTLPAMLMALAALLLGACQGLVSDTPAGGAGQLQLAALCPPAGEDLPEAAEVLGQKPLDWAELPGPRLSTWPEQGQCWLRAQIAPAATPGTQRLLVIDNPHIALVRFYVVSASTDIRHHRAGADLVFDSRPVSGPFPAFPLPGSDAPTSAWLAASSAGPLHFNARVMTVEQYQQLSLKTTASQSAVSGALLLLALWLLVLFAAHRDRLMLYLGLWLALSALAFFNANGLGHMLFWPGSVPLNQYLYPVLVPLLAMLTGMAGREFLTRNGASAGAPLTLCIRTAFVLLLATPFLPRYPLLLIDLGVLLSTLAVLAGNSRPSASDQPRVRRLGMACLALLLSLALCCAAWIGVLPYNPLWLHQLQLVVVVIAVLMALMVIVPQRRHSGIAEVTGHDGARAEDRAVQAARSRFLATLSHQIRTPLNGILGMADLLRRNRNLPSQGMQQADTIFQAATALVSTINDILDHSAIQRGTLQLSHHPVQPDDMLSDVIDLFAVASRRKDVPIYCYIDSRVPHEIVTDEVRVKQILTNLVSNALRHTDNSQIEISISTRELDPGQQHVVLNVEVSDSGCGLDNETHQRLAQLPANGDSGLQISRQLVALLGGELTFSGAAGHGASFCFTLPAKIRPAGPLCLENQQVTVLTDSSALRLSLSQMLHRWGVRCHDMALEGLVAPPEIPGQQALILDAASFNALDTLPGCKWPDVPLVVIGGAFTNGSADQAASTGVPVPLKPRMLKHALARVLTTADTGAPVRAIRESTASLSVLVVDDDQVSQLVIASLLHSLGVQTRTVGSGEAALEALAQAPADVVFMDWEMPDMGGEEVTRRIRQGDLHLAPWIICLTAHGADAVLAQARAAGVDDFLPKPVNRQQVRTALRRAQTALADR